MPATPKTFEFTAKDFEKKDGSSGGLYSLIDVPADYPATLVDVNDYKSKTEGWKWTFEIMGCEFDVHTAWTKASRWKIGEMMEAFGYDPVLGIAAFDPNPYIGTTIGAHVDWQYDPASLDEGEANYREIKYCFPLEDSVPAVPATPPPALEEEELEVL